MDRASADPWPTSPDEARRLQNRMRERVITEDRLGSVRVVAGIDAHYAPARNLTWAAVVALRFAGLDLEESVMACQATRFPYVTGLLSFREAPTMLDALGRLSLTPDLLLVDGQGIAHPRGLGLASHVGLLADLPTIGVGKTRLVGRYEEPGQERGAWSPLVYRNDVVGAVLRTRPGTRPLFISTGHRISLLTAIDLVLRCTTKYRLPEPIRLADRLSREHAL